LLNLNGSEPRLHMISLDADNLSGGDIGQGPDPSVTPVEPDNLGKSISIDPEPTDYYHSLTIPNESGDDEVLNFKDSKELDDKFLENYLRQSDYTKKTQSLARQREQFEAKEASFSERETAMTRLQNQLAERQELIEALPEDQFQKLLQEVTGKAAAQAPELPPEVKALIEKGKEDDRIKASADRKSKQAERFNATGRYLKTQFDDYDHDPLMADYDKLMNTSPETVEQSVLELLYYARKGKGASPAPADPQGPARTRSGGGGVKPQKPVMSIEEGRLAGLASIPARQPLV